ncbi:MAG: hypothetical protein ACR2PL_28190 [Dehalococcoidia bacterium]
MKLLSMATVVNSLLAILMLGALARWQGWSYGSDGNRVPARAALSAGTSGTPTGARSSVSNAAMPPVTVAAPAAIYYIVGSPAQARSVQADLNEARGMAAKAREPFPPSQVLIADSPDTLADLLSGLSDGNANRFAAGMPLYQVIDLRNAVSGGPNP